MGRPSYVCTVCSEHFTRKYSGRRHNQNLHNGAADIVGLIDYLAGRSSGQYTPDNPFWHKRANPYRNIGTRTVADSIGITFRSEYIPQQAPMGTSQYSPSPNYPPVDASQTFANPMYRRMQIMNDQSYGTSLSQDTILQIEELKQLVNKYHQYQNIDPGVIVKWAVHGAINGDTKFLHDKLDLLHTIERLAKH